jgi:hypothetical protein
MISFKQYLQEDLVEPKRKISAENFIRRTKASPWWCKRLNKPLLVEGYVKLEWHPITHLSPHLIFEGAVSINHCDHLKILNGIFKGNVWVTRSAIERVENVKVLSAPSLENQLAVFHNCPTLKYISGDIECSLTLPSTIEIIENLTLSHPNYGGKPIGLKFIGDEVGLQKVSNFKWEGEIIADDKTLAKFQQLHGQEKAGGKGEFDDLF